MLLAGSLGLWPAPAPAASQVYFDGALAALVEQVEAATASIDVAIFDFTSAELATALVRARDRGVAIRIVADARQARGRRSAIPLLRSAGIDVRIARGRGVMHQKFAIFDGRLLVTGSYNWTDAAERRNSENALFLDEPALVARYGEWFERQFAGAATVTPATR